MPAADAIELPAGVTAEDMKELLEVDVAGWKAELDDIKNYHFIPSSDRGFPMS